MMIIWPLTHPCIHWHSFDSFFSLQHFLPIIRVFLSISLCHFRFTVFSVSLITAFCWFFFRKFIMLQFSVTNLHFPFSSSLFPLFVEGHSFFYLLSFCVSLRAQSKENSSMAMVRLKPELSDKARETVGVSRVSNKQCFLALRHAELKH